MHPRASHSRSSLVADHPNSRLDKYLAELYPDLSRSYLQKLITDGYVTLNDQSTRASAGVKPGDRIEISVPPIQSETLAPESIPLTVIYEDDDLFVIDKPAGIPTHPGPGSPNRTVANALLAHHPALKDVGDPERPGIVHRLDKDTSGLLIVAKSNEALEDLSRQFKSRLVVKRYLTLVKGRVESDEGVIDAPIGRSPRHRKKMSVVTEGRRAVTRYRVVKRLDGYTLLEVTPETGRTHQIRVHLAAIGHPVAGDVTYGSRNPALGRQFLHACFLGFRHPVNGDLIELSSELPEDLKEVLASC